MKSDPSETPSRSPAGTRSIMSQASFQLKSPLTRSLEIIRQHFLLCNFTAAAPTTRDLDSKVVLDHIVTSAFHSLPFPLPWLLPMTHLQLGNTQERKKITKYYLGCWIRGRITLRVARAFSRTHSWSLPGEGFGQMCPLQPGEPLLCWALW